MAHEYKNPIAHYSPDLQRHLEETKFMGLKAVLEAKLGLGEAGQRSVELVHPRPDSSIFVLLKDQISTDGNLNYYWAHMDFSNKWVTERFALRRGKLSVNLEAQSLAYFNSPDDLWRGLIVQDYMNQRDVDDMRSRLGDLIPKAETPFTPEPEANDLLPRRGGKLLEFIRRQRHETS